VSTGSALPLVASSYFWWSEPIWETVVGLLVDVLFVLGGFTVQT
jgi:hypothetical protein